MNRQNSNISDPAHVLTRFGSFPFSILDGRADGVPTIMKRTIVAFCFVLAVHVYAGDSGPFQLFAGTIQRDDRPMAIVLKINTQTGQTWQLLDVQVKPHVYVTAWAVVSEDLLGELHKLEGLSPNAPTPKPSGRNSP